MKRPASQRHLKTAAKRAKSDDDYFEIILKRPGLQHIAESIFSFLNDDVKSMAKCREVSSDFKNLIDRQKTFFIKRIQKMNEAKGRRIGRIHQNGTTITKVKTIDFVARFPKWKKLLDAYDKSKSLDDLKVVADFMSLFYSKRDYNQTPFYAAVQDGHVEFLKLFIEFNVIELEEKGKDQNSSFHHACASGLTDVVEVFVEEFGIHGTGLPKTDLLRMRERFEALRRKTPDDLRKDLKTKGIKTLLKAKNINKDTPLHLATKNGHFELVQYFMRFQHLQDLLKDKNDFGNTLYHLVCSTNAGDKAMIKFLMEIDHIGFVVPNLDKLTPLELAHLHGYFLLHDAIENDEFDVLAKFINNEVLYLSDSPRYNVEKKPSNYFQLQNDLGETIHHKICAVGNMKFLRLIIRMNKLSTSRNDAIAGFDAVDKRGQTPFHVACKTGNLEIVQELIDLVQYSGSKWILDLEDYNGDTPLQLWIDAKRPDIDLMESLHKRAMETNVDLGSFYWDARLLQRLAMKVRLEGIELQLTDSEYVCLELAFTWKLLF